MSNWMTTAEKLIPPSLPVWLEPRCAIVAIRHSARMGRGTPPGPTWRGGSLRKLRACRENSRIRSTRIYCTTNILFLVACSINTSSLNFRIITWYSPSRLRRIVRVPQGNKPSSTTRVPLPPLLYNLLNPTRVISASTNLSFP